MVFFNIINCISLIRKTILQHLDEFQIEIQTSLMKLPAFKAFRGHPQKLQNDQ